MIIYGHFVPRFNGLGRKDFGACAVLRGLDSAWIGLNFLHPLMARATVALGHMEGGRCTKDRCLPVQWSLRLSTLIVKIVRLYPRQIVIRADCTLRPDYGTTVSYVRLQASLIGRLLVADWAHTSSDCTSKDYGAMVSYSQNVKTTKLVALRIACGDAIVVVCLQSPASFSSSSIVSS